MVQHIFRSMLFDLIILFQTQNMDNSPMKFVRLKKTKSPCLI